jgi:alkyl sulfatase BDS1-like metallo-beta-lactamase superfamily hydrolase
LAKLPYLREGYGKVNWAAASVFRQNTGWYSFNPKDLKPLRPGVVARAVLEAVRGADSLLRRARRAIREEMPQLALELTDIVLNARPLHPAGRQVKAHALRLLATRTPNRVERNLYLAEAKAASRWLPPIAEASRQRGHEKRRLQHRVCRQRIGPRRDEAAK